MTMTPAHAAAIQDVLAQMRAVARTASVLPASAASAPAESAAPGGFAAALAQSLERVSSAQQSANAQARSFQAGAPGVELHDVMIDMQKASIAFQATVQVRNRLVAAYQEIASMPV